METVGLFCQKRGIKAKVEVSLKVSYFGLKNSAFVEVNPNDVTATI